jgi:heterodisulfide reductase subunit A
MQIVVQENGKEHTRSLEADAIVVATGFKPFNPKDKPFGSGQLANVITNLELERLLHRQSDLLRPCDGNPVRRIAFIQCVGSRDASAGHRWCSQVCCGSALRMARLIQHRNPQVEVAFFYIDVQSIGKDFKAFDQQCRQAIQMVRAIPGEIYQTPDNDLRLIYFDPQSKQQKEAFFDLAVLSVGMLPGSDSRVISEMLQVELAETGFFLNDDLQRGIFSAGAAKGPMSIADCIGSAGREVWAILNYLDGFKGRNKHNNSTFCFPRP